MCVCVCVLYSMANKYAKVKILNSWQWWVVIVVPYHCVQVVVVDVVSLGTCVCQTDSGKLLEGKCTYSMCIKELHVCM